MAVTRSVDPATFSGAGFAAPIPIFGPTETDGIREAFDALEAAESEAVCTIGLFNRHLTDRFIWDIATDARVLDAVETVLGADLLLLGTHFFCKYPDPAATSFVAWHQDLTYWQLDPPRACTAWVAIDDVDIENGCMRVIPGSHAAGPMPHGDAEGDGNLLAQNQEIPRGLVDEERAVDIELRAGSMSLHDGYLVHGSAPNRSTRRRCGLAVRFVPGEVGPCDPENPWWHTIAVRGACADTTFPHHPHPFPVAVGR